MSLPNEMHLAVDVPAHSDVPHARRPVSIPVIAKSAFHAQDGLRDQPANDLEIILRRSGEYEAVHLWRIFKPNCVSHAVVWLMHMHRGLTAELLDYAYGFSIQVSGLQNNACQLLSDLRIDESFVRLRIAVAPDEAPSLPHQVMLPPEAVSRR